MCMIKLCQAKWDIILGCVNPSNLNYFHKKMAGDFFFFYSPIHTSLTPSISC